MSKLTILNVDDYAPGRYARTQLLRGWGFEVKEAGTGAEALRLAALENPALIILDVQLPDMDGFEVCRRLRREHNGATLPILHISATFTSGAYQALGLDGGADGYLVEPVEPAVLRATIDAMLRMRRAERALRTMTRQWEATFDGIADGIAVLDPGLKIVRCNAAFARMFGPGDLVQRPVADLWDRASDAVPPFVRVWKSAQREVGDVLRGGRWYRLTVDPITEDGAILSAVCFVSEITEARRLAREQQTRFDHEQQARVEAEAASRAKDDFLAILGHELRTPLMPITMAVRALQARTPDDPDVARTREIVDRQVRYLTRLVDDLLDMSRLTRQKLQLSIERVDLREVVADAVETTRQQIESRRHHLTVHRPDAAVWVDGDPVRLGQIVVNLVTNAAKFTPPGGNVAVALARDGSQAVLSVQDDGIGIAAESLPTIFEPFTQGERVVEHAERGLGVGLALVRGLVGAHGGRVSVASNGPGCGSEFVVRLPVRAAATPPPATAEAPLAQAHARILVVEDHADSRAMLAEMLELEGHEVTAVADGADAVEIAQLSPPHVAIVDIGLHGMDGYEVARRLRGALGDAILLVAVTGYGQAEDIEQSRVAGFDAHVTKPIAADELLRVLHARIRR
jgi:signal transduction histidine kinase